MNQLCAWCGVPCQCDRFPFTVDGLIPHCCQLLIVNEMPYIAPVRKLAPAMKDRAKQNEAPPVNKREQDELFALADRLAHLMHQVPRCPKCGDAQVQIIGYFETPAVWKCRCCKERFEFEPDPK